MHHASASLTGANAFHTWRRGNGSMHLLPVILHDRAAGHHGLTVWHRFSQEELERLDAEGRVVITDHGAFVLVNVYGPAITSEESAEERYAFKLRFYEVCTFPCTRSLTASNKSLPQCVKHPTARLRTAS